MMVMTAVSLAWSATVQAGTWVTGTFTLPAALSSPSTNSLSTSAAASSYAFAPGCAVSVTVAAHSLGTDTSTVTNYFDLYNGTTWSTSLRLSCQGKLANGTNVAWTATFTPAQLAGYQQIRPGGVAAGVNIQQCSIDAITYGSFH
jgi:hypothetical protein